LQGNLMMRASQRARRVAGLRPARRSKELRHSDYDYNQWGLTRACTPLACAPPNLPVMPSSQT
jgi:hypothetical protein